VCVSIRFEPLRPELQGSREVRARAVDGWKGVGGGFARDGESVFFWAEGVFGEEVSFELSSSIKLIIILTCVDSLALAEMRLILAKVLFSFDLELVDKSGTWMSGQKVVTLWQKPDLMVELTAVKR
jgi:hypothetical protein